MSPGGGERKGGGGGGGPGGGGGGKGREGPGGERGMGGGGGDGRNMYVLQLLYNHVQAVPHGKIAHHDSAKVTDKY